MDFIIETQAMVQRILAVGKTGLHSKNRLTNLNYYLYQQSVLATTSVANNRKLVAHVVIAQMDNTTVLHFVQQYR